MSVAADMVMAHASSWEFGDSTDSSSGNHARNASNASGDSNEPEAVGGSGGGSEAVTARLRKRLRLLTQRGGSASAARSSCHAAAADLRDLGHALTVASLATKLRPRAGGSVDPSVGPTGTRGSEMLTALEASRPNGHAGANLGAGPDPLRHHIAVAPGPLEPGTAYNGHNADANGSSTVLVTVSLTASAQMARLIDDGYWTYALSVEGATANPHEDEEGSECDAGGEASVEGAEDAERSTRAGGAGDGAVRHGEL